MVGTNCGTSIASTLPIVSRCSRKSAITSSCGGILHWRAGSFAEELGRLDWGLLHLTGARLDPGQNSSCECSTDHVGGGQKLKYRREGHAPAPTLSCPLGSNVSGCTSGCLYETSRQNEVVPDAAPPDSSVRE